jgi:hypothetical protein
MLGRVALEVINVSHESIVSIIRVTRISELETMLSATSNRNMMQQRNIVYLLVAVNVVPSSPILVTLKRRYVPPKHRFLQESHGVTSQETAFFIVTAVKT